MNRTVPVYFKKLHPDAVLPWYAHGANEDAGMDLVSIEDLYVPPGRVATIRTGLAIVLPKGCEAQVRTRSGLASKFQVTVANSPGTIDPGYRGEIKVLLMNHDPEEAFRVRKGDRIAQLVIARYERARIQEIEELPASVRGEGGFGSSGRAA
ncbi:MAG: dUTP diphosphatase [Armatimonadetes bacterium]|nr:dUTP diphosphatase [Armatimonadota bacterium]